MQGHFALVFEFHTLASWYNQVIFTDRDVRIAAAIPTSRSVKIKSWVLKGCINKNCNDSYYNTYKHNIYIQTKLGNLTPEATHPFWAWPPRIWKVKWWGVRRRIQSSRRPGEFHGAPPPPRLMKCSSHSGSLGAIGQQPAQDLENNNDCKVRRFIFGLRFFIHNNMTNLRCVGLFQMVQIYQGESSCWSRRGSLITPFL